MKKLKIIAFGLILCVFNLYADKTYKHTQDISFSDSAMYVCDSYYGLSCVNGKVDMDIFSKYKLNHTEEERVYYNDYYHIFYDEKVEKYVLKYSKTHVKEELKQKPFTDTLSAILNGGKTKLKLHGTRAIISDVR